MNINNKRQETSKKRIPPKIQRINEHMKDYDRHFEDLQAVGVSGTELMQCAGRFITTFWIN